MQWQQWPENRPAVDLVARFPRMPMSTRWKPMAIDQADRTVSRGRAHKRGEFGHGGNGRSLDRLACLSIGHDWMRNGVWPLLDNGRWLGTSPDWQTCLRCSRWELV